MHEAHEAVPDRRPDQGTPGDDAQAAQEDLATDHDLEADVADFLDYVDENEEDWLDEDPRLSGRRAVRGLQAHALEAKQVRERVEADLETAARLGIEVGQLLFSEPYDGDSRELDRLVPAWARRFNAEHAGQAWKGIEYADTIALFALRRFREWAKGGPRC